VRKQHFRAFPVAPRLLEGIRFGEGTSNIAGLFMDIARDHAQWSFRATPRLQRAYPAILGACRVARRGYMFRRFRELHGNDDAKDLCWFAPSNVMNPQLPAHVIDKAMADDPQRAGAEFLGR
jgi:hypothetical protein